MSILQEYEEIRKRMGEDKYHAVCEYLDIHTELNLSDIYYKEEEYRKFEEWYNEQRIYSIAEEISNRIMTYAIDNKLLDKDVDTIIDAYKKSIKGGE